MLLFFLPAAWLCGLAWSPALLLGAAAGGALALARSQLAVQRECLTYVRLLGVRLETRRRCGLAGGERFLPLRQLGGIIIHEEVSATRADFYLALSLRPDAPRPLARSRSGSPACDGAAASSSLRPRRRGSLVGGASKRLAGEGCEVEVVFPCLRPRLSLLRQVYQQLQPLLQADLETLQQGTEAAAAGAAAQQNGGTAQTPQGEGLPEREGQRRSPRRRRAETL